MAGIIAATDNNTNDKSESKQKKPSKVVGKSAETVSVVKTDEVQLTPPPVSVPQSWSGKPLLLIWLCSSRKTLRPSPPMASASLKVTSMCGGSFMMEAC